MRLSELDDTDEEQARWVSDEAREPYVSRRPQGQWEPEMPTFDQGRTLDVDESVSEVPDNHVWRVDAVDESWRCGRGRVHVRPVDRVNLRGDDTDERVDKADGDLQQ